MRFVNIVRIILLAIVIAGAGIACVRHVRTNAANLDLTRSICWDDDCYPTENGYLVARRPLDGIWQRAEELSPCQALWLARLHPMPAEGFQGAIPSNTTALSDSTNVAFKIAQNCPRFPLIAAWNGMVAWIKFDQNTARTWWSRLPTGTLIEWGYQELLHGEVDRGRFLLETALANHPAQPYEAPLLQRLGDSYRLEGNWTQASHFYRDAWQRDMTNPEVALYLAISYRETGQPAAAQQVLETTLPYLPEDRAYFVTDYYIQLGLALQESEKREEALIALQSAQAWLELDDGVSTQKREFLQSLVDQLRSPN